MGVITSYGAAPGTLLTDCVVPVVDIHDPTMAGTGTTKKITLANLLECIDNDTDTNIKQCGAQGAGAANAAADAAHVHPAANWIPSDNGLLAANGPMPSVASGVIANAGNLFLLKIWIRQPFTATNLWLQCSAVAVGASTTSFAGIWNSSGTLLTGSADIGSTFLTTGAKSVPWTTPQALTVAMGFVWVGFVFNMATTQPTLRTLSSNNPVPMNTNLTAALSACAVNGTGITSLASITPSSNNQAGNATPFWAGIN